MTFNLSRIASAETSLKDSAQSPACSTNARPCATSASASVSGAPRRRRRAAGASRAAPRRASARRGPATAAAGRPAASRHEPGCHGPRAACHRPIVGRGARLPTAPRLRRLARWRGAARAVRRHLRPAAPRATSPRPRAAIDALDLDEVVVTVAGDPQRKAGARRRRRRLRARDGAARRSAASTASSVSDLELHAARPHVHDRHRRGPPGRRTRRPRSSSSSGADAAGGLGGWHRAGDLARLVDRRRRAAAGRRRLVAPEGFSACEVPWRPVDLSSTAVRAALRHGATTGGPRAPQAWSASS